MSKKLLLALPAILSLLLLSACAGNKPTVDYDTDTDFSQFHYYQLLTERSGAGEDIDPLLAERVKEAVLAQLANSPLKPANKQHPADVLVRYYVASSAKSQTSNSRGSVGLGGGGGGSFMGVSLSVPLGGDKVIKEVQVIVDMLSPDDQQFKWRGSMNFKIDNESPEQINHLVNAVVADIFQNYPPKAGK